MKTNNLLFYRLSFFKNKQNLIILSCIIVISILITSLFFLAIPPKRTAISGTLFIDSIPAPGAVDVKIVFANGEVADPYGTDEQGQYYIDVSRFVNEVGTFIINYNGTVYFAYNYTGDFIEMIIIDSIELIELDLFVFTTSGIPSDYNDSLEDDTSDNLNDDDLSDTNINTSSEGTIDNTSSVDEDNVNGNETSSSGSGSSGGGNNNQNTEDDEFTINSIAGLGGIISPNGSITVSSGDYLNFTITPDVGYSILDVLIDNFSQGSISYYNFSSISDDHEIYAEFKALEQPPIIFGENPLNNNKNNSINQAFVMVTINDLNYDLFNWTIEGKYVFNTQSNNDTDGIKSASLITPLLLIIVEAATGQKKHINLPPHNRFCRHLSGKHLQLQDGLMLVH